MQQENELDIFLAELKKVIFREKTAIANILLSGGAADQYEKYSAQYQTFNRFDTILSEVYNSLTKLDEEFNDK